MNILVALLVIVVVFVMMVFLQPAEFKVSRSANFSVPPEIVFAQVNNLRKWEAWSPWAKLDLNAKNTYTGPAAGVGAAFAWSGNNKVGEGRMTITESSPYELVRFQLVFLKPFKATNIAEFSFKAEGHQTTATWCMSGENNFMGKAMNLMLNCEKMVGRQFEQGLAQLKSLVEAADKNQR
ncbi:MAG: SRPBCC family protein [Verrucomicrobiia bacterium]